MKKFEQPTLNFTTFTEVLFNILLVFVIIMSLSKVKRDSGDPSLAPNVMYQLVMDWDGKSKTDLDLWSKDPAGKIVGFNNREGGENSLFSLAHDDLGAKNDSVSILNMLPNLSGGSTTPTKPSVVIEVNQEIISLRGTKEGEYVVNGHCYNRHGETAPLPLKATCKLVKIKPFKEIRTVEREFKKDGDEVTFFRFKVDVDGNIYDVSELPQKIVSLNREADVDINEEEK